MANADFGYDVTFPVGASALAQFKLVKTPAALVVGADAADDCIGIVQNGYDASAAEANVRIFGVTYALAHDGSISKGDLLECAAAGRVDTYAGTSSDVIIGMALEDSSAQDDEILIFLFNQGFGAAA